MPHDRMLATRGSHTWINKYIFPGGFLPSVEAIDEITRRDTTLRVVDRLAFGAHYAETLRQWDERFRAAPDRVRRAGVRPDVPADVALLPGVLPRRVRVRVPRRASSWCWRDDDHDRFRRARSRRARPAWRSGWRPRCGRSCGGDLPVRLRAWDGSEAGPVDAPLVVLRSPDAVRRMLWRPGELGAAQAYVTGELDVEGDLGAALSMCSRSAASAGCRAAGPPPSALLRALRTAAGIGALGRPPAPPATQARVRGRLHSQAARPARRSATTTTSPTSSTRCCSTRPWPTPPATGRPTTRRTTSGRRSATSSTWSAASSASEPGSTLLDVGCGWGSLALHAAEHFGARVTGITIAAEQKAFIDGRIRERGLDGLVEIRLQDYRDAGRHLRRRRLDRDGRARRRGQLPDVRRRPAAARSAGRPRAGAADVADRPAPRRRAVHRVLHRAGHAHAAGRQDRRVPRGGGPRGTRRARAARALRADRRRLARDGSRPTSRRWSSSWARRRPGSGGSTSSAARLAFRDGRMGVDQILCVRPDDAPDRPEVRTW